MPIIYKLIQSGNAKPRYDKLTFCHHCGSTAVMYDPQGYVPKTPPKHPLNNRGLWSCMDCGANVRSHSDGYPQGFMAQGSIKALRYEFHKVMQALFYQSYTYDDICNYLQCRLEIHEDHMHAAWLTQGELIIAIGAMTERLNRPRKNTPRHKRLVKEHTDHRNVPKFHTRKRK